LGWTAGLFTGWSRATATGEGDDEQAGSLAA